MHALGQHQCRWMDRNSRKGKQVFGSNSATSLTAAQFERQAPSVSELEAGYSKSDPEDIAKMERLLDLKAGALGGDDYYLEKVQCKGCARVLTMYDFVFTGIVDANHPKSLIVHTFLGNKYILNEKRPIQMFQLRDHTDGGQRSSSSPSAPPCSTMAANKSFGSEVSSRCRPQRRCYGPAPEQRMQCEIERNGESDVRLQPRDLADGR